MRPTGLDCWVQFWAQSRAPFFGSHFWSPILGPSFGFIFGTQFFVHFWVQFLTKNTNFGGQFFGSKFGSVFGVQNLDSLIFLIGDHFWDPFLGSKYGPKSGPPKLTKNVEKVHRSGAQKGSQIWHTEMLRKLSDLAQKNYQIFPNRLHIWFPNRAKHDFESGPIICANLTVRREADLAPQKGFVLQLTRGSTFGVRGYPNIQSLRGSRSGTQVRNNSWRWVVFSL